MKTPDQREAELRQELAALRGRLEEAEETLRAIQSGEVDALVMGEEVYTLKGAETPYRILIEQMYEGAGTLADDGTVLYANRRLAELLRISLQDLIGASLRRFIAPTELPVFEKLLADGKQCSSNGEFNLQRLNGSPLSAQLSFSVVSDQAARPICVTVTDLTERKRAEEALRQAHDLLEQRVRERTDELQRQREWLSVTLSSIGDALIATDAVGRITFLNPVAETLTGWSRQEVLDEPVQSVFRIHDQISRTPGEDIVGRVLREGAIVKLANNTSLTTRSGQEIPIEDSAAPIMDSNGKVAGAVLVFRDVTAKRGALQALRQSEELHRVFFELAAVGMAYIGLEGRFLKVNDKYCELTGYTQAELASKRALDLVHPEDRERDRKENGAYLRGEVPQYLSEKRYLRKDGSVRWVAVHARLVREPDGRPRYSIEIINDISGRKRAEEAVRQAAEELKRSNRDLEQFASVASHDLQEPLRAVSGYVRLLQRGLGDKLSPRHLEYITGAVEGAQRMEQLIDGLLEFSRVGTREHDRVPADLNELLRQAQSNLRVTIKSTSAKVTTERLPTLAVDAVQITQLFQNLIGNAIKFCAAGQPKVEIRARQEPSRWVISVRDNGIGIAPEHFERIFQIFQRLHTRSKYPGTGIGLAICQRIVERHGGRIWVESQPGQGSTFFFSLPEVPESSTPPNQLARSEPRRNPALRKRPQRRPNGPRGSQTRRSPRSRSR